MTQKLQEKKKKKHLQKVQNIPRQLVVKLQVLCLAQRSAEPVCVCALPSGLISCKQAE